VARGAGVIIPALLIAALLAAAVVGMARGRAWSFLAAGFLILLAPTSSLLPLTDMAAEHRMYLPLAAVLTALVRLVYHAGQSIVRRGMLSRSAAIAVGGCLTLAACATLGIFTSRRNVDYRSEISLWEDTVAKTPGNARAHYNLGVALLQSGRVAEAMGSFRKALDITPRHAESHYNLGVALAHQQRLAEAVAQYQQALEINPHVAAFHCTLGIALLQQGRFADATTQFQKALEIRPRYAEADYNWGEALSQQGRLTEAIACYRKALEIDPRLAEAHNNLGNALGRLGKAAEAMAQYQQALSIRPDYAEAHYNLGVVYGRQGRLAEALAHYQRAVDTRPDFAEAQNNLASASYQLRMQYGTVGAMNATAWVLATTPDDSIRNGRQAVASAQRAVQLSDNRDPAVLDTLAAAYAEAGQFVAAIETARRAWELASAGTDKPLANHIHARIVLYRNQKPYRTPTASPTPRNRGAQE
jgi:tetratricopeptide (TPR) repeat protein